MRKFSEDELANISAKTIADYSSRTSSFWHGTKDHDVSQNIEALLKYVGLESGANILDFGCGPGRDLVDFRARGHNPIGLDGCETFCDMARTVSGCEVLHQDFLRLNLPESFFHGVFANATMFHVPMAEMRNLLRVVHSCLVPGGVLLCSNPRGDNVEVFKGDRYCAFYELEHWQGLLSNSGFELLEHYYRPVDLPKSQQPWLVTVWRRI